MWNDLLCLISKTAETIEEQVTEVKDGHVTDLAETLYFILKNNT